LHTTQPSSVIFHQSEVVVNGAQKTSIFSFKFYKLNAHSNDKAMCQNSYKKLRNHKTPFHRMTVIVSLHGGLVVQWLGHRTCDQQVVRSTPGRALPS